MIFMATEQVQHTTDQCSNLSEYHKESITTENVAAQAGRDVIRSVSMSANVASSVWQEVNHLIHINAAFSSEEAARLQCNSQTMLFTVSPELDSVSSAILPAQDNVLLGLVISRWDDIVGPQTVHVWLQRNDIAKLDNNVSSYVTNSTLQDTNTDMSLIVRAVHYATCHTVNCTSVSAANGASNLFVVPDLDMICVSYLFHSHHATVSTPFSVALLAHFNHYLFLEQRYQVMQQWLKRFVQHLKPVIEKWEAPAEVKFGGEVDSWVLEVNSAVTSLHLAHLDTFCFDQLCKDVLAHPALAQFLTSHLQTFGCSVIIGTSAMEVNSIIIFLSLFLEDHERHCSRLVPTSGHCSYNLGLYLQGLLLNGFGYREISSSELAANKYPVTVVDLTRGADDGAVKQTFSCHQQIETYQYDRLNNRTDTSTKSLLHPMKESARLVTSLLKELSLLPVFHWNEHISIFRKKIVLLAKMLISLTHESDFVTNRNKSTSSVFQLFKKKLGLGEADFLIILSQGEKIKPGLYSYVMGYFQS